MSRDKSVNEEILPILDELRAIYDIDEEMQVSLHTALCIAYRKGMRSGEAA